MPYGITRFRCTVVKPYYHNSDQLIPENKDIDNDNRSVAEDTQGCDFDLTPSDSQQGLLVKRGRGRPKGTRNQPKLDKVRQNYELAVQPRSKGIISTPGKPFEISHTKEFEGLRSNGAFILKNMIKLNMGM
ncbi:hypothetical protein HI914_06589 [Erysiphe necator]|nr:hypothetical protein HI914_06589 [Erysiphe necator]